MQQGQIRRQQGQIHIAAGSDWRVKGSNMTLNLPLTFPVNLPSNPPIRKMTNWKGGGVLLNHSSEDRARPTH
jgi:hypothetical protein